MNITIQPKEFYEVNNTPSSIQNLSHSDFYYQQNIGEPEPDTGYILRPFDIFKFVRLPTDSNNLKCWLYNPNNSEIKVRI